MPLVARKHTPSWARGFARRKSGSAYPGLWDGLVGAWFPSLGPTGLTLRDIGGYDNHGTLTLMDPATDWVTTERGWALDFDGVNGIVSIPHSNIFDFSGPFSVGLLFRFTANPGATRHGLVTHKTGNTADGWGLTTLPANGRIFLEFNNFGWNTGDNPDLQGTEWRWLVAMFDQGGTSELWVDAQQYNTLDTSSKTITAVNEPLTLARYSAGSTEVPIQAASLSIWDRFLQPNEIQQLYHDPLALVRPRAMMFPVAAAAGNRRRRLILLGASA